MTHATLRIGEVAGLARVTTSRIRFYERIGLLPAPLRVGGQRRYDVGVLRRLAVIDVAQRAGLSLADVRVLLEHGTAPMGAVLRELADRRVPEIDALLDDARRVRAWLVAAQACDCRSTDACPLFLEAPATEPIRVLRPSSA